MEGGESKGALKLSCLNNLRVSWKREGINSLQITV